MQKKTAPISYKGHESFGMQLLDIYSKLGVMREICLQFYDNPVLLRQGQGALEIVHAFMMEMDRQFKNDYPTQYRRDVYFH